MHLDNDTLARMQRTMIINLQLYGGSKSLPCLQAMGHISHCLIQNRGRQAAMERTGGIPHPRQCLAGHYDVAIVLPHYLKVQHLRNGTWNAGIYLRNSAPYPLNEINRLIHRVRC